MKPIRVADDAMGHALVDYLERRGGFEVFERDDGLLMIGQGPRSYLRPYSEFPDYERQALRHVRGRVLDVGCGGGRVALHLQERGFDVVAIDPSPLAIHVCRARTIEDARVLSLQDVTPDIGLFDTILMFGNNFGLFGSLSGARRLLRRLQRCTNPGARILAGTRDPHQTDDPVHLGYQRANKRSGKMPGQIRMRIRYRTHTTPWFNYLMVSKNEMHDIIEETGWKIRRFFDSDAPEYIAWLERDG